MDHSEIAPLAKRLAEENNVDWRRLRGSGVDGQIVERDVLEYLARVMAGEEAVDPTPEPVPEGMESWPEDDVRRGAQSPSEVDPTSTIDDDIFIFDDVEDEVATHRVDGGASEPDALWSSEPIDLGGGVEADDLDDVDLDTGTEDVFEAGDARADADARDWLGSDDAARPSHSDGAGEFGGGFGDERLDLSEGSGPVLELDAIGDDADESGPPLERGGIRELPDLFMDEAVSDDTGGAPDALPALLQDDATGEVASPEPTAPADVARPSVEPVIAEPAAPPPSAEPESVEPAAAPGMAGPPVAEPVEPSTNLGALPLMRHPHVWRRQIDLTALVAAQADLAAELGRDEPVALQAFLLRAGAKALAAAGGGAVALAQLGDHGVRVVPIDTAGGFAGTVAALDAAWSHQGDHGGEADPAGAAALVVADLSDVGVDEATFELAAPVLTLGRVLIDNQSGARRAYLALSGEAAAGGDAAKLLARIADLLERPVRVVV